MDTTRQGFDPAHKVLRGKRRQAVQTEIVSSELSKTCDGRKQKEKRTTDKESMDH